MAMQEQLLDLFRKDLCKDQRKLEVIDADSTLRMQTTKIIRKHSTTYDEHLNEVSVMDYLRDNGITGIPKFLHNTQKSIDYVDIEYFEGIRVFNMLAYLREIVNENPLMLPLATTFRDRLLERCMKRQSNIQKVLISWRETQQNRIPYPLEKLKNMVYLLANVMHHSISIGKINEELDKINQRFESIATVPFRDATTKNMILHVPSLHLNNFFVSNNVLEANEKRKKVIFDALVDGTISNFFEAPLVDIDFSSCENDTTIYDDPIGFSCHEISWNGIPDKKNVCWNPSSELVDEDIALSFIIRFLRFGGRKLAYKIIHSDAYKYRFYYDNGLFYFKNLNTIINRFWNDAHTQIPNLMQFIDLIANADIEKFVYHDDNIYDMCRKCDRKFYIDIYPN